MLIELFVDAPHPRELAELGSGPIRLSVVPSPPVSWLVLTTDAMAYDGSYFLSVEDRSDAAEIGAALSTMVALPDPERQPILFYVVDKRTNLIAVTRLLSVSGAWMQALGTAILAGAGMVDKAIRGEAVRRDYERWPKVRLMLPAATASEIANRA